MILAERQGRPRERERERERERKERERERKNGSGNPRKEQQAALCVGAAASLAGLPVVRAACVAEQ
jgi:hypothetical protein